jgi:hypothetical protein
LTDTVPGAPLPAKTVRVSRTPDGIALYFPPLRMPEVALPLAAFGAIASALPGFTIAALLPAALADTIGLMSAVLIAAFIVPFAIFGVIFVVLALYMICNALSVRVHPSGIDTTRMICGVAVRHRHIARSELSALEPEISARHQSLFSSEPVYQLVARDAPREKRVIVAETLKGEAIMERVKSLIETVIRES